MYYNRHRYTLVSSFDRLRLDTDPLGWEEAETKIARSEKTYGIFITLSNNLEFTGKAKDFLERAYSLEGVQANVELIKEVKHPQTDDWQLGYRGFFDFTTRRLKDNKLKMDLIEGGLRQILVSQIREKHELNRTTDISGNPISTLKPDVTVIEGREIHLLSGLESQTKDFKIKSGYKQSEGETVTHFYPLPLESINANSDPDNVAYQIKTIATSGFPSPNSSFMFYLVADRDRGKINIETNVTFNLVELARIHTINERLQLVIKRYAGGDSFLPQDQIVLKDFGDPRSIEGILQEVSVRSLIEPKKDESYSIGFAVSAEYGDVIDPGYQNLSFAEYSGSVQLKEDSFFEQTTTKALAAYDVGERLTEIYTGKPAFKSSFFKSGKWKDLIFTCGGWIRNLQKKTEEGKVIEWPLTINWEDYYKSLNAIEPVAYGIITEGNKQFIALEDYRYFFQPVTTIKIEDQVSNLERETATDFIFSSIATGYQKGGNYEKPLGLDEYNVSTNYIGPINKLDRKYEVLGTSRTDSYAVEQARRMQALTHPDTDTEYDKDTFLIDCKLSQELNDKNVFAVRTWPDDFEKAPTGVYSPDTAFNLRLTPAHNRNRHSFIFNAGIIKTPEKSIRYTSSQGNSQLSTKPIGKAEVKENSDVLIKDLSNPIFDPEYVSFEIPFTQDLLDKLQGHSKVGEEMINNYYGLIEFKNEKGNREKGYLMDATISMTEPVKIRLLKAYS